ncbi:transcription antitermination factor NusB [Desulfobacteraceae bacterium SEEP-SAG10]|nr:transcription antitermination factor NusB [Desulfobacteraceae bacterium SEEP-SAG10]
MGNRRKSREIAMQALFYMDMSQNDSNEILESFCNNFTPPRKMLPFFLKLVKGVMQGKGEIDSILERFSDNWKLSRMSCVDRNTMRIAVYELLYCHDIPYKVSINEAIDVGKKFGTKESGAFINGILDSIRIALEKEEIIVKNNIQKNQTEKKYGLNVPDFDYTRES